MHPFMDPRSMTDDQLYDKIAQAQSYLAMQSALGHQPAVESIENILFALESERQDRFMRTVEEETKKQNPHMLDPINIGVTEKVQEGHNNENQQL